MTQSGLTRTFGFYERAIRWLAGGSMAVIVTIMIVQVIARYIFNSSLIWAEELCRYILIWQTFLFVGYAYYRGELVVLDLFSSRVSPRTYMAIRILTAIPVAVFLYMIISAGLGHALRSRGGFLDRGEDTRRIGGGDAACDERRREPQLCPFLGSERVLS